MDMVCTMEFDSSRNEYRNKKPIKCYCMGHCPNNVEEGTCELKPGGMCFTSIEAETDENGNEENVISYGCLSGGGMGLLQCKGSIVPHKVKMSIQCCNDVDLCNKNLTPVYKIKASPSPDTLNSDIFIPVVCVLGCCLAVFLITAIIMVIKYRKRSQTSGIIKSSASELEKSGVYNNGMTNDEAVIAQREFGTTKFSQDWSGSGSGPTMMIKRTIGRQIQMEKLLAKGRYGQVWLANWGMEKVAVKVFPTTEEIAWLKEIEIYMTATVKHDNILGFIAADIIGHHNLTKMILITEYHSNGSLFDFLQDHTLTPNSLLVMSRSIARGLSHLHTEIFGIHGKPAIAHKDIKSRNILVKKNGECCLADFGLAVKLNSYTKAVFLPCTERSGTKRYMAPEILDQSINPQDFNAHKMTDIYSLALVLWEMTRRCAIDGQETPEYAVPFHDSLFNNPDYEEMINVICIQKVRPEISEIWNSVHIVQTIVKIMREMWHHKPEARLTALRVRKTFEKLSNPDVSINMD